MEARPLRRERNFAVIQYENRDGQMKVIAFSDWDIRSLMHRVSLHMNTNKKVLSIQFYYAVDTSRMSVNIPKKGVIIE